MASVVMRSTGPRSIGLSSQLPPATVPAGPSGGVRRLPGGRCEPTEAPGVVHQQDAGDAVAEVHHGNGGGIHEDALELVQVGARVVGDEHPDEITVGTDDDPTAWVPGHDPLDLVEEACLSVHEALAGGEVEPGRTALHRIPELRAPKGEEGAPRPVPRVHLDQRL